MVEAEVVKDSERVGVVTQGNGKIFIGIPTTGPVDFHLINWMFQPAHRDPRVVIAVHLDKRGGFVENVRQEIADKFLGSGCEWFLMVDSDTIPYLNALELVNRAEQVGALLVAYPTPFHGDSNNISSNIFVEAADGGLGSIDWHALPWDRKDELFTINAAGMGCTLIHREVLETMCGKARMGELQDWPFRAFWRNGHVFLGEDLCFFIRAGTCGFETYTDLGNPCAHRKAFMLSPNHAISHLEPGQSPHPNAPQTAPVETSKDYGRGNGPKIGISKLQAELMNDSDSKDVN